MGYAVFKLFKFAQETRKYSLQGHYTQVEFF